MNEKIISVKLDDDKTMYLNFKQDGAKWICTMDDETMCDIWMFYPHVIAERVKQHFGVE